MAHERKETALLLIDFQKGFDDIHYWGGQRNNPDAENNAHLLLTHWREHNLPIFHVRHNSLNPGSPLHGGNAGYAFKDLLAPAAAESIITKHVNSAFIGTALEEQLNAGNITRLVIAGLTTDHCVSTTTRMAGNLGYETFLVADATATFNRKGMDGQDFPAELIHETALASLNREFATVLSTRRIIDTLGIPD